MRTVVVKSQVYSHHLDFYLSTDPREVLAVVCGATHRQVRLAHVAMAACILDPFPPAWAGAVAAIYRMADCGFASRRSGQASVNCLRNSTTVDDAGLAAARRCLLVAADPYEQLFPRPILCRSAGDPCLFSSSSVADSLRSIFPGHSFSVPVTHAVRVLAGVAYHTQDRLALLPLSDLLEEEGAEPCVLDNLRNPHSAIRGNWVLDAILGKR